MGREYQKRSYFIIGLDFGTTHTGVAYALSGQRGICTINKWPGPDGKPKTAKQVPSVFAYDHYGNHFWGYQVKPDMTNRYSFMKLHLDKNAPSTDYHRSNHRDELQKGYFRNSEEKTVEDVTREYLFNVLAYTRKFLEEEFGNFVIDSTRVEFWLTKPIASGDQAQHTIVKMAREAAIRAGFSESIARAAGLADNRPENIFGLVEESVAGLTANLLETNLSRMHAVKPGDKILVCDCGGGQIDIGVYMVGNGKGTLELDQVTIAQSLKVGSAHIDRRLHRLMVDQNKEFKNLGPEKEMGSHFMTDFEERKREFGNESSKRFTLRLEMKDGKKSKLYRPSNGTVTLSEGNMKWMFESTIEGITKSLSAQLDEANNRPGGEVKDLALVGGLGDSPYLKSTLKQWCESKNLRPRFLKDSWNAVAKGVVAYGLGASKITKRLTQNHYGVRCAIPFDPKEDDESEKYYFPWDSETPFCKSGISWLVGMGVEITKRTAFVSTNFVCAIPKRPSLLPIEVFCSKTRKAPRKIASDTISTSKITAKLDKDDVATAITGTTETGKIYSKFSYNIQVLLGETQGTVIFQPRSGDKVLGSGTIDFQSL